MERRKVLKKTRVHLRKVKLHILIWTYKVGALRVMQMFSNIFAAKLSLFFIYCYESECHSAKRSGRSWQNWMCRESLLYLSVRIHCILGLIRCFSVW